MDWFQGKAGQLIALASIVGTLAGFGYTGATYVNRIENLEKKIAMLGATEDAQNEIEERFSAIETSVEYINKSIDDTILITIKQQGEIVKVLEIDVSTMETRIEGLEDRMDRADKSSDNPLAG
tara:strand:+ start:290 stop:658 length:369 start_codon:yes stop_codon:yes gene_type:complete